MASDDLVKYWRLNFKIIIDFVESRCLVMYLPSPRNEILCSTCYSVCVDEGGSAKSSDLPPEL